MAADESKAARGSDTLHDGDTLAQRFRSDADDDTLDAFGDLGPGAELGGRYLVESIIGKGATGVVFEASHLVIGKRVALKCVYPQHSNAPNVVERFFREAKIAATVEHPNVIQVFDGGKEGEVLFLAMERLEGESLGDRLEHGAIPTKEAVQLFLAIMDGVAAVHERGVVHRDLKPDNIFLATQRDGRATPKVLDFGISKLKEPGLRELTTLGTVMGTPFYMAPEQITSTRDVDARADVYSLGVMLYEALVGGVPFADESVLRIFRRVQSGDTAHLERLRERAPAPVARVVEVAMHPDRDRRFASVMEMREALATASLTDPAAHPLPAQDVPTTMSELEAPPAADEDDDASRSTIEVQRIERAPAMIAPSAEVPPWVWWALAGAAVVTFASMLVALIAIVI